MNENFFEIQRLINRKDIEHMFSQTNCEYEDILITIDQEDNNEIIIIPRKLPYELEIIGNYKNKIIVDEVKKNNITIFKSVMENISKDSFILGTIQLNKNFCQVYGKLVEEDDTFILAKVDESEILFQLD